MVSKNLATHFSDTDYVDVSLTECARLCSNNPDYPCRAFFFGQTILGRFCGLMHLPAAAVASIPGGIFPLEGVNIYEPARFPRGQWWNIFRMLPFPADLTICGWQLKQWVSKYFQYFFTADQVYELPLFPSPYHSRPNFYMQCTCAGSTRNISLHHG